MNSKGSSSLRGLGWVGFGCGLPASCLSAGFGYAMSGKAEKKRKAGGWGGARKRAAQAAVSAEAGEATQPASELEPELEAEPVKKESGGYMLPGLGGRMLMYFRRE